MFKQAIVTIRLLGLVVMLLAQHAVSAQEKPDQPLRGTITGAIADTTVNVKLENASICILNASDSTLVTFTQAASDGSFRFNNLRPGKFILLASYPGYADYVDKFDIKEQDSNRDFGALKMLQKSKLLAEVLVKGTASAIKIKGDTTEYNADAFKIAPNAKVEDLLKQLPGIQVDREGKITAQGQAINKVLVDGEEFFGDDPTLVTKNIRGDMVDKVQLFDKKSDQAAFTGIDDGKKTKTLNIKLKEDKKTGAFGKVEAGAGTDGYYKAQAMYNTFRSKSKFSAYTINGNTGETDLSWQDNGKYGSPNQEMQEEGVIISSGGWDELESFDGRYNGQGIPQAHTGGLHYENKWNKDKESINSNYKIGALRVKGNRNTQTQYNLPNGIQYSNSDQDFNNYIFRQKLNGTYLAQLDSTSTLKIYVEGALKNNTTHNSFLGQTSAGNDTLLNKSSRSLNNEGNQKTFSASALWNKKFKKPGRTISVNVRGGYDKNETEGLLYSNIEYYNRQLQPDSIQIIDQSKNNLISNTMLTSSIVYSEPLSNSSALLISYGLGINNGDADKQSYNKSNEGHYNILDSTYSNHLKLDQFHNQAGVAFNYKKQKTLINIGTKVTTLDFKQSDLFTQKKYDRNFFYLTPQASYQYQFSGQKFFRLGYMGNNQLPTIDQVQAVQNNVDPLNIVIGNPDLKQSFINRIDASYRSIKTSSTLHFFINGAYNFTIHPIVNNVTIDSSGHSVSRYFNLSGNNDSRLFLFVFLGKKIKKIDMDIETNLTLNAYKNYNFINDVMNRISANSYSFQFTANKYVNEKYNFRVTVNPNYNTREYSLQQEINNNGWGFNSTGSVTVNLPLKMELSTDGNYQYAAKTTSFNEGFERFIWNASLSKKFLKQQNLRLTGSVNDLLNQNIGFSRDVANSVITQNKYTTIKRYFMLSVIWDFTKTNGVDQQK